MDDADITAARDEAKAPARLAASHRPDDPVPTGRCLYCDEILDDYSLWCGPGCRDQWQKEQKCPR